MPRYLIKARYTPEGLKGLLEDGGTRRREAVINTLNSVGGKLEALYFAMGEDDAFIIVEVPDNAAMAAIGIAVGATGTIRPQTIALLTPEEVDKAVKQKISFRAPGR
jgi:uncharacterized protein with GYD domain